MLLLTGSTPSLAAGDAPPPIFDEIAASVRFATAAEGDDGGAEAG
jgi:hypothetical protein